MHDIAHLVQNVVFFVEPQNGIFMTPAMINKCSGKL